MSSFDTLQQPSHDRELSFESHDEPANLHDTEIQTLPVGQQTPLDAADLACPGPPLSPPDSPIHPSIDYPGWKRLISSPLAAHERTSLIAKMFSNRSEIEAMSHIGWYDAQTFIDVIYEALDNLDHVSRMRCLRFLCKICGRQTLIPRPLAIVASYDRTGAPPGHGGFADVWKGRSHGRDVAIKVLRMYQCNDHEQMRRRFCREVVMWTALRHPNVLSLMGVMITTDNQLAMVTEWMVNGNVNEFVKVNKDADRLELLGDVGRGLDYLHSQDMVHGDLKGANILIDHEGHARIADFGTLMIISDQMNFISSISHLEGGTFQWMSPELLDPDRFGMKDGRPTKESDCYAFGTVIYEVLSGQVPFPKCSTPVIILKVMADERPGRPQGVRGAWFTDDLWKMLEQCWKPQPCERPGPEVILRCLEGITRPLRPSSPTPTLDEDPETDSDERLDLTVTNPDPSVLPTGPVPQGAPDPTQCGDGGMVCEENLTLSIPIIPIHKLSTPALVRRIAHWNGGSPQEIGQVLTTAFRAEDYSAHIRDLNGRGIDTQSYINSLDQIIGTLPSRSQARGLGVQVLTETCILHRLLPTSYTVALRLGKPTGRPFASGGISNIWKSSDESGQVFALRVFIGYEMDPEETEYRRCYTQVIVGKHVNHPNVFSIEGVTSPELFKLCTVSGWMVNRNIAYYTDKNPGVNRLDLLVGVTHGLEYLHDNGIVHGGLESSKILIDDAGTPRIHRFGTSYSQVRYFAPERMGLGKVWERTATYESDVYSLSMVIVELATGKMPFSGLLDTGICILLSKGKRPQKPHPFEAPGFTPDVWRIAEMCWHEKPKKRPTVRAVLRHLEDIANGLSTAKGTLQLGDPSLLRQLRLGASRIVLGDRDRGD